ncbi:MAG: hypothetical protein LYZ69_01370 [Nitrososphaerales archaeon]|nr:hypothetical protein [Nitrososphaerales archaeon]
MAEFEAAMASACESTLKEVLGLSGFASTVYRLSMNGVSLRDCASRPADFDDFLSVLFNPVGATLVEGRILKRFYGEHTAIVFRWGDSMNFCAEVRRARQAFEDANNSPQ